MNAGSPQGVKEQARKVEDWEKLFNQEMKIILGTPAGRRVFWTLMEQCEVGRAAFLPNGSENYFRGGKQYIGGYILGAIMEAGPELYVAMMKEAKSRQQV